MLQPSLWLHILDRNCRFWPILVSTTLFFWGGGDGKCPILSCILFEIFRIRPTGTTCHAHCICIVIGTERFRYTSYDVPLNYQVSTLAVNWKEKIQTCPPPPPLEVLFLDPPLLGDNLILQAGV